MDKAEIKFEGSILNLSIFNSVVHGLLVGLQFFLAIHLFKIGLSGAEVGLIFFASFLSSILTILPSGLSSDKVKAKNLIIIALLLIALNYFGLAKSQSFLILFFSFFIGGMGRSIFNVAIDSLFYKQSQNQEVAEKIGIYQGLSYFGMAFGMITAGYFFQTLISFEKVFLIVAVLFVLATIAAQLLLPSNTVAKFEIVHYKNDLLKPRVLLSALIFFLFIIHVGAEFTSYGPFLKQYLKLNNLQIGLYMGTAVLVMAPTVFLISKKLKTIKAKNVLLLALILGGLGHILMVIPITGISLFFRIVHEIGDACMFFALYYGISKLFEVERIGGNTGFFKFLGLIGGALGSIVFGPIAKTYGYHVPIVIGGLTTLVAFVIAWCYIHHFDHD